MSRLIDADAIPYREYLGDDEPRVYRSQIDAMPTTGAASMVHGQWIDNGEALRHCSECGAYYFPYDYCPSCGAKMDKEGPV